MKYLHVEWMVAVPDTADIELLKAQAAMLIPSTLHGLTEIVGGIRVTTDADYPDENIEDIVNPRAIDLLREITTRGMTESETRAWYRKVEVLLALDDLEDGDGEDA